jgi:DNA-binding MarR family transcriptional regulator
MRTTQARVPRPARRFDSLEQEVFLNLWRTYDRLRGVEDELFQQFALTPQLYNILRLLQAEYPEGMPTLQLAARLVSRAPDITRMLDKLEERSLIARHRLSDNRRVVEVRLTESGSQLLDQIAGPLQECHVRQLGHLTAAELKQLRGLLQAARSPHETTDSPWT